MIDGLNGGTYNSVDETLRLGTSAGSSAQGSHGVDRPLLQRALDNGASSNSISSPSSALARRLVRLVPYDVLRTATHAYRRLQAIAWPELVDREVAAAAEAYSLATGHSRDSEAFQTWAREFRDYALCSLPAQLTAVVATHSPREVERRVHFADGSSAQKLSDPQSVVAVSRTGMAFVLPWLLTVGGHRVALIAEPSVRASSLLGVFANWSPRGEISLIGADAWALVRAKRAIKEGYIVVIFPESFGSGSRRSTTPFMKTSIQAPLGAAALAFHARLPIQPVCVTSSDKGALVELGAPLDPNSYGSLQEATRALFEQLGTWVLRHPAEWVGWHDLAKHIHAGER